MGGMARGVMDFAAGGGVGGGIMLAFEGGRGVGLSLERVGPELGGGGARLDL
jgi:hypothetical protein